MEDVNKILEFLSVGYGDGSGYGSGDGYGDGSGSGSGDGFGYGYGSGSGSGDGLHKVNDEMVFRIDGVMTLIDRVRGNIAKGRILMMDFATKPCYVVKNGSVFAHGDTLREAMDALNEKLFEDMPEEERIEAFVKAHEDGKAYPNTDFFDWHNKLTGSCEAGRKAFAQNHGVDMSASMTVKEFILLTENDYGGSTIKKLRPFYGLV